MARSIIIVNATQLVTSDSHPEGIFSVTPNFPQVFDSGVNGDVEQNMKTAKAAYYDQLSKNYANTNPNRIMTTVTLETVDGRQILHESIGSFAPEVTPEPEGE